MGTIYPDHLPLNQKGANRGGATAEAQSAQRKQKDDKKNSQTRKNIKGTRFLFKQKDRKDREEILFFFSVFFAFFL
jgi:hypothetical protein